MNRKFWEFLFRIFFSKKAEFLKLSFSKLSIFWSKLALLEQQALIHIKLTSSS